MYCALNLATILHLNVTLFCIFVDYSCSLPGTLGVGAPLVNGSGSILAGGLPSNGLPAVPVPGLAQMVPVTALEPIGTPSECLLLKNMFDPATEVCIKSLFLYSRCTHRFGKKGGSVNGYRSAGLVDPKLCLKHT